MPVDYTNIDFGCGDPGLDGVCRDCSPNPGGIMRIAIAPASLIQSVTVSDEGVVTSITPAPDASLQPFKEYWVNKKANVSVFNTAFTSSETSAGGTHQNDLILQLAKMNAITRAEDMKLLSGEFLALYQQRSDRLWFLLGVPGEPAEASAGDGSTGAAIADYNGYNLTLSTTSDLTPYEVDPELAESLISGCSTGGDFMVAPNSLTFLATDPSSGVGLTVAYEGYIDTPVMTPADLFTVTAGPQRNAMTVKAVSANTSATPRTAVMTITQRGTGATRTVKLTQLGAE